MSPEDRDSITTSIANLWTINTAVMAELFGALESTGALFPEATESALQRIDMSLDQLLEGEDDQARAAGMLASVRTVLRHRRGG